MVEKLNHYLKSILNLLRYDARVQIGTILCIVAAYAVVIGGFWKHVDILIVSLSTGLILDGVILRFKLKKWARPSSAVVTSLLIGLILNPNFALWRFVLIVAVAIASKYLIFPGKKHIFNPAAFGLVTASLIFDNAISWWGVAWSQNVWIFLFVAAGLVLLRLRRIWLPVGFLAVYWIFLISQGVFTKSVVADPTTALFAFIMLPEPQTSPITGYLRYTFGILVALFVIIYTKVFASSPFDPFLISLLSANFAGTLLKRFK